MKHIAAVTAAAALAACATQTPEPVIVGAPDQSPPETPAVYQGEDATSGTYWTAIEKPWPEQPLLVMINPAVSQTDAYALSFSCNSDTGAISGALQGQDVARAGEAAVFSLKLTRKSEVAAAVDLLGDTMASSDLAGVFESDGVNAEFDFPIDWLDLNGVGASQRAAFVSDTGETVLALTTEDVAPEEPALKVASLSGFNEAATQFYYFCNPK